jgi:hypothetical protein
MKIQTLALAGTLVMTGIFFSGCVNVKDTVYLETLQVDGPIAQPPVHLTIDPHAKQFHITPRFSQIGDQSYEDMSVPHSFAGDTFHVTGKNFRWTIPASQAGLDMDYLVSDNVAITGGFTVSSGRNTSRLGGNLGIGFPFQGESLSARIEGGIQFQELGYDAYSVRVREITALFSDPTREITYFHDVGSSTPVNGYFSLTINTHADFPINVFGGFSYSNQTLASFSPRHVWAAVPIAGTYEYTDTRADHSTAFFILTPGLAFTVTPKIRLLAGARIMYDIGLSNGDSRFVAPMMQWDMTF